MAPRKTRTGASATTKRSPAKGRSAASSASRSSKRSSSRATTAKTKRTPARSKQKKPANPRQWWTFPALVIVALAVFGWAYYPVARVQYRETREKTRLAAELESLKARNDRLRQQVDRLRTPEGVEDYARSQLGLVKKGENVVVVVDGDEQAKAEAALATPEIDSAETTTSPAGPWTAFLDLVFGVR